jgi:hypothetical protein
LVRGNSRHGDRPTDGAPAANPTAAQPDTVVTDYATLIRRGVFEMPEKYGRNHISYSHTAADIDASLAIAEEALTAAFRTHTRPPS